LLIKNDSIKNNYKYVGRQRFRNFSQRRGRSSRGVITEHQVEQNSRTADSTEQHGGSEFRQIFALGCLKERRKLKDWKKKLGLMLTKTLLDRTEDDIPIEEYLPPVGESEYQDYFCFNGCGCDAIPEEDNRIINRHHFHYRDIDNKIQRCSLISKTKEEKLPIGQFPALGQAITEINYMLENTYRKRTSLYSTILLAAYTPKSFTLQQFSLQLQSLLVAREHLRQVLSTLKLRTYHYSEFLQLQNSLTSRLGVHSFLAKLVLPSLKEPRFVFIPSAIPYPPFRKSSEQVITFGIRQTLGGFPRKFVHNGVFHSKYEWWQLLFELIVYDREPKRAVALNYIRRLFTYLFESKSSDEATYNEEDYAELKQLVHTWYREAEQVGNITELVHYRRLV